MKKLLITLVMATALVAPAAAPAHGRHHHHHWAWRHAAPDAKRTRAGTFASTKLGVGTFTSSDDHRCSGVEDVPSRHPLVDAGDGGRHARRHVDGDGRLHGHVVRLDPGRLDGVDLDVLGPKRDGTVKGALVAGVNHELLRQFTVRLKDASHHTGGCR